MDNQTLSIKPKYGYGFIYCYTSPSGKKYIGKTKTDLKTRAKKNFVGYKGCVAFYNAIQKYGWENFEVEILEECPIEVLLEAETQYILDMDTTNPDKGYNIVTDYYEFLATLKKIPVYSYDGETGIFIEKFDSISDAERAMGVYRGSIRRIINSPTHHVRNRLWKTEFFQSVPIVKNNVQATSKKVYQYDPKTGDFLKEFSSIREAARQTGYDRNTIMLQVAEREKRHSKYLFRGYKVNNLFDESSTTIPCGVDSSESKKK